MWILLNVITVFLYAGAAGIQYGLLNTLANNTRFLVIMTGIVAVFCHAIMLYHGIDIDGGQNLGAVNLFSLASWFIATLMLIFALYKPVESLGIVIFPLAGLSILFAFMLPSYHLVKTGEDPRDLVHILLSVLSFSVLVLAAIQAGILALQQQRLRLKQTLGTSSRLPSIETMESILFQLLTLGFILLSILLFTSLYFYHTVLWQRFMNKTILACAAWLTFAILLFGRQFFGWRGKKTVYCTLGGIFLLTLTYFSTSMILGILS